MPIYAETLKKIIIKEKKTRFGNTEKKVFCGSL